MHSNACTVAQTAHTATPKTSRPKLRVIEGGKAHTNGSRCHKGSRVRTPSATTSCSFANSVRIAFAAMTVFVILCVAMVATDVRQSRKLDAATRAAQYEVLTIHSGDSIWNIAQDHPLKGCTIAQTMHHIRTINGLESALLMPGMQIRVPS